MFGLARLIRNEDAVTIQIGHVLSFSILIIFIAVILLSFNSYVQSSANQAMRVGYTALGNDIARDITNLHLINATNATIKKDIPHKIGGEVYYISANNSNLSVWSGRVTVNISIENIDTSGTAGSASGEITLNQTLGRIILE